MSLACFSSGVFSKSNPQKSISMDTRCIDYTAPSPWFSQVLYIVCLAGAFQLKLLKFAKWKTLQRFCFPAWLQLLAFGIVIKVTYFDLISRSLLKIKKKRFRYPSLSSAVYSMNKPSKANWNISRCPFKKLITVMCVHHLKHVPFSKIHSS